MKGIFLYIFIVCISIDCVYSQGGPEICDNAIDDDMDGLIDLNDTDCICVGDQPVSLIPNPSFEDMTCCPTSNAQLDCAVDWIQASAPTTDYIHLCDNYLGNVNIPAFAPLPLPDGEGAVGFRDGEAFNGAIWKEYVGACLISPLLAGIDYRLELFVGFQDGVPGSTSVDLALFGGTTCTQLPFGNGQLVGCPANTATYDQIDIRTVSGSNEWVTVVFEFTPTVDYEVMVIGPGCPDNPNASQNPYFFIDGLFLAESVDFGVPFEAIDGSICNDDLRLTATFDADATYQWYKDGIAIIGATDNELSIANQDENEGLYQCIIESEVGCFSTFSYTLRIPPYFSQFATSICEGDTLRYENQILTEAGTTPVTTSAADGCDSIILVDILLIPNSSFDTLVALCIGDTVSIFGETYTQDTTTMVTGTNAAGCDSIVSLIIETYPEIDAIELDDEIDASLGELISYAPIYVDPDLVSFTWYDGSNNIVSSDSLLTDILAVQNTTFEIIGLDENDCPTVAQIELRVSRRTAVIHVPNIFSPNGDFINDFFTIYGTRAIQSIDQFVIYDRWGNLVHQELNIPRLDEYEGWDGYFQGQPAAEGVYAWMVRVTFLDQQQELLSGDVTLIR